MANGNKNVPALRPRFAAPGNAAMQTSADAGLCDMLTALSEAEAKGQVHLLASAMKNKGRSAEVPALIDAAMQCRSWSTATSNDLAQLRARFAGAPAPQPQPHNPNGGSNGGSKPGCGCERRPMDNSMSTPNYPHPSMSGGDFSSKCFGYRQPDSQMESLAALDACGEAQCKPGTTKGLQRIPFSLTLAAAAGSQIVTVGFTRPARLVAITFIRWTASYDPDDWTISGFQTSETLQAYDLYRPGTTFGSPSYNPNNQALPLNVFLEDGDDALSAILHAQNYLPTFLPGVDIGTNQNSVSYTLNKGVTGAAQTIFGFHWVVFTGSAPTQ